MRSIWPRTGKFLAAAILLFAVSTGARAAETLRYLFLVDHSPEMATRQITTVQTIYDVVRTGFQNEIKADEKFAIWFYGSRLQMNPPFTWQPGHETEIARAAANLFTGRIYSRLRPREQTLADAAPFIAASPKITVFIITDGGQPLAGTPFDTAINATITSQHFAMLRADKPFVITLLARNGNWVDGNIFANPKEPFEIPELDRRNELMEKALASVRTAPGENAQSAAGVVDLDKARAALRDALAGKTAAPAPPSTPVPDAPKQAPILQNEVKPKPIAPANVDKPAPTKLEAAPAAPQNITPPPTPAIDRTPPPLLARPIEVPTATAPEQPKPTVREEPKPVVQQTPPPIQDQPKVLREETKPPREEPKPIIQEQPKPIVREEPKVAAPALRPTVEEKPKQLAQAPIQRSVPPAAAAQTPKPIEQAQSAINKPPTQPMAATSQPSAQPPKSVAPIQTATVTPQKPFPLPIFVGGLLAIFVGGAFALRRAQQRSRSPGSIITQALPRSNSPKKLK